MITWLDDCTRYALHVSAHRRVTGPIVTATFRETAGQHGIPASTLTDNGMVYTVRLAGGRGGRNTFEHELRACTSSRRTPGPATPPPAGRSRRFQQTMKKWLRAQPVQPATIAELQVLLDAFVDEYNQRRPHRSLPHRATPAARYNTMPKAVPGESRDPDTHDRVRHDRVDKAGSVTIRHNGRLHHIGIGRTHAGTCVILLVQDLHITGRQRHHRRAPPRPDPRPQHATTSPPEHPKDPPGNEQQPDPVAGPAVADVLRHHTVGRAGVEPATP